MPSSSKHVVISSLAGAAVMGLVEIVNQSNHPSNDTGRLDWELVYKKAGIGLLGGFFTSTLPDILEPATNPNHRKFAHSILVLISVGFGAVKIHDAEDVDSDSKTLISSLGVGYCAHLLADGTTPKGLPVI